MHGFMLDITLPKKPLLMNLVLGQGVSGLEICKTTSPLSLQSSKGRAEGQYW